MTKASDTPIHIRKPADPNRVQPMEIVEIAIDPSALTDSAVVSVLDGAGNSYFQSPASASIQFLAGGALGRHTVLLRDGEALFGMAGFRLDCRTELDDGGDWFSHLLTILRQALASTNYKSGLMVKLNGKLYVYYSSWLYDHMYAAMGFQYYQDYLRDMVDLFAEGQREDGMIYDNYKQPYCHDSHWAQRFDYGNFVKVPENPDSSHVFVRIPIENSCEYHFIECLYRAWKATGDTAWMEGKLANCLKAVEYCTSDPYRWSEEHQLMKKGYSIDMWDFQSTYDAALVGGDSMKVTLEDSHFNIFYGDNGRMAASCHYLAEMLDYVGRTDDAIAMRDLGDGLKARVDAMSWRGTHYEHMIPLEPDAFKRDFGLDTSQQVTLHNAWLLNRGVTHDQAVAIIKTYQRIREEMPETSPGEFYTCYPPFEQGWNGSKWEYMNGGVTPIAAGELSRGAFEHGFETYGVDILKRIRALAGKRNGVLEGCYKGAIVPAPERSFTTLDLRDVANVDFVGDSGGEVTGWTNEGENDLRNMPTGSRAFADIAFDVIDPARNGRRACLGISREAGYLPKVEIKVGQKAKSIYLLHTKGGANLVGYMRVIFDDQTEDLHYIADEKINNDGPAISNWWNPNVKIPRNGIPRLMVAWKGTNPVCNNVGVYAYGYNNPHPGKVIDKIVFEVPCDDAVSHWMILGVTLSDADVYFEPAIESGIPAQWGAGEMYYGFVEGLVGIQDTGVAFDKARIVPRWEAADKDEVRATFRYAASDGYVSYHYKRSLVDGRKTYQLTFTGPAREAMVELLLPEQGEVSEIRLDGKLVEKNIRMVESSRYAILLVQGVGVHDLAMTLEK